MLDDGVDRSSTALGTCELVDADVDRDLLRDEQQDAPHDHRRAHVAQRDAAIAGPEDRGAVQQYDEHEQVDAQEVDGAYQLLERVDLVGLEHDELAGIGGDALDGDAGKSEPIRQFDEQRTEIDDERCRPMSTTSRRRRRWPPSRTRCALPD